MTKLEQKLIELKYENRPNLCGIGLENQWSKYFDAGEIIIELDEEEKQVIDYYVKPYRIIRTEQDLKTYKQAFDEMQKDLEILKECEE